MYRAAASVYLLLVILYMLARPASSLAVRSVLKIVGRTERRMGNSHVAHAGTVVADKHKVTKGVTYDTETGQVVDCIFCNIRYVHSTSLP